MFLEKCFYFFIGLLNYTDYHRLVELSIVEVIFLRVLDECLKIGLLWQEGGSSSSKSPFFNAGMTFSGGGVVLPTTLCCD